MVPLFINMVTWFVLKIKTYALRMTVSVWLFDPFNYSKTFATYITAWSSRLLSKWECWRILGMVAAVCIDDLQSPDRSPQPGPAFCSLQLSASECPLICPEVKTFTKWKIEPKLSPMCNMLWHPDVQWAVECKNAIKLCFVLCKYYLFYSLRYLLYVNWWAPIQIKALKPWLLVVQLG